MTSRCIAFVNGGIHEDGEFWIPSHKLPVGAFVYYSYQGESSWYHFDGHKRTPSLFSNGLQGVHPEHVPSAYRAYVLLIT